MLETIILLALLIIGCMGLVLFLCCALEEDTKGCLISFVIFAICCFLFFYPVEKADEMSYIRPDSPYVTHEIMVLADNNMMSGRIYMRSGYIEEAHYYLYGYKNHQGGMKTQKVKADNAVVFFTDDVEPCAKWYKEVKSFWYLDWVRYTCDIYLPTDALVADYAIDLQ